MMNTNFRFSNLIGTVYKGGNVLFSSDGYSVISPVGNKITIFDLKNNVSNTIAVESNLNIEVIAINPVGTHAFLVNEGGEALYVNLLTQTILYRHRFHRSVGDAKFSPDGRYLAACRDGDIQVFLVAGVDSFHFNPFVLHSSYKITVGKVKQFEWSYDGKLIAAGSEDKQVRIVAAFENFKNLSIHSLAAHKADVIGAHFSGKSYDLISVDKRGLANQWTCTITQEDLVSRFKKNDSEEVKKIWFEKSCRHNMIEHLDNAKAVSLTASTYHRNLSLLVTAFSNGAFLLHEMPNFNLIHCLRVSDWQVKCVTMNASGDWLAVACCDGSNGQLLVWEWQSEAYIMKQQSHSQSIVAISYSPDGSQIATGAQDGKVKIWSCRSSFCVVTFTEHTSSVSAVCWTPDTKAVLSSSLDGTVRAHDLIRYRNFRTLVCPEKTQLGTLAVDSAAELVMASSIESFNIYVWSLENGRLLDVLSGHSAQIVAISVHGTDLATVSWDKTLKIWNVVEASNSETIDLLDEALDVAHSPSGDILAVLCYCGTISMFETNSLSEVGVIETLLDVDAARNESDIIKKKTSEKNRTFTCICFSADGSLIAAAGQSNYICLYDVAERILLRKLRLTTNQSLDGVKIDISRRNLSEFGNMNLIDASDSEEEADNKKRIKLPGTKHSDLSERHSKPEMRIHRINFSPAGRSFAVCSTEGVAVFSLAHRTFFNPFELGVDVTPESIEKALSAQEFSTALKMSLKLGQSDLVEKCLLATPVGQIDIIVRTLSIAYAEKLLQRLTDEMNSSAERHINFWMLWLKSLLLEHGLQLKQNRAANLVSLTGVQQKLSDYSNLIAKLADQNKYTLDYIIAARQLKPK